MRVTSLVSTGGTSGPVWKMPRLPGRNSTTNFVLLRYEFAFSRRHQPPFGIDPRVRVSSHLEVLITNAKNMKAGAFDFLVKPWATMLCCLLSAKVSNAIAWLSIA
jgi:hypothetical protein